MIETKPQTSVVGLEVKKKQKTNTDLWCSTVQYFHKSPVRLNSQKSLTSSCVRNPNKNQPARQKLPFWVQYVDELHWAVNLRSHESLGLVRPNP